MRTYTTELPPGEQRALKAALRKNVVLRLRPRSLYAARYAARMGIRPDQPLVLVKKALLKTTVTGYTQGVYGGKVGQKQQFHRVVLPDGAVLHHPDGQDYLFFWVPDTLLTESLITAPKKSTPKPKRKEHPGVETSDENEEENDDDDD